mmetsp:Transcript_35863/g.47487  ORF Transcript_35863/g.47487 Transcript_35863/m.47487 type:complete len:150 (+) Transcript_35863:352-801(+)
MLAVSAQVSILFFPGGDTRGFESKVFSNADCDCQSKLVCFCSKMPYSPRLNFIFVTLYFFDRGWVVGYLTNTGIKFLAVIEDTNDKQQQQSRESDLKHLFVSNNVSFSCFDKSLIYMHSDFIWCDRYCILLTGVDFYSKTDLLEFFFTC